MKKLITMGLSFVCLLLCLSGCASPFSKEYQYIADYEDTQEYKLATGTEVKNIQQLRSVILSMIYSGTEEKNLSFTEYDGSVTDDLSSVIGDVRYNSPIGLYALSDLTCETNRIVSYYVATLHASYSIPREKLYSIATADTASELDQMLDTAGENFGDTLIVEATADEINEEYISRHVHEYYLMNPMINIYEPEVSISSFPESGSDRIYEISFSYRINENAAFLRADKIRTAANEIISPFLGKAGTNADDILAIGKALIAGAGELSGGIRGGESPEDILSGGDGSSLSAALAFKVVCDELDIDSMIIEGIENDISGEECCWNMVCIDGAWYHADLTLLNEYGAGKFLISDDEMWEMRNWDASLYPECTESWAFPAKSEDEAPEETPAPIESEAPQETPAPEEENTENNP